MTGFVPKKTAANLIAILVDRIANYQGDDIPEEELYVCTKDEDGDLISLELNTIQKCVVELFENQMTLNRWDEDGRIAD